MSFQFSPETLITIAENQIEQKQNEIQILQSQLVEAERSRTIAILQIQASTGSQDAINQLGILGAPTVSNDRANNNFRFATNEINRITNEINTKTNEIRILREQIPSLAQEETVRAENIAEQFAPFFENLTIQIQNLLSPIVAPPVLPPPIEQEVVIIPVEEVPVERNNTLRNLALAGLIVVGGVLVFR